MNKHEFRAGRERDQFGGRRDLAGMMRYLNGSRDVPGRRTRDEDIEGKLKVLGLVVSVWDKDIGGKLKTMGPEGSERVFIPAFNPAEGKDHRVFRDMGLNKQSKFEYYHRPFWLLVP